MFQLFRTRFSKLQSWQQGLVTGVVTYLGGLFLGLGLHILGYLTLISETGFLGEIMAPFTVPIGIFIALFIDLTTGIGQTELVSLYIRLAVIGGVLIIASVWPFALLGAILGHYRIRNKVIVILFGLIFLVPGLSYYIYFAYHLYIFRSSIPLPIPG